jgi:CO dehydrogenase/acetyl-CoA synthase delta subunit
MENGQDALIRSLIKLLAGDSELELEGVTLTAKELTVTLADLSGFQAVAGLVPVPAPMAGLVDIGYVAPARSYPGKIREVILGSTRGDGGSRVKSVTIGGA